MKAIRIACTVSCTTLAILLVLPQTAGAANSTLLGWNNLGMHCMDSDYSVFSILPPYNTIEAQLIVGGVLVTNGTGYTVTYQAVADPDGSFNSTSIGKGNFYNYVLPIYGASPPPDMGLTFVWGMPGSNNVPQGMLFETTNVPAAGVATPVNWFRAEGIPLTPYDDAGHKNPYPLMRLVAHDAGGNELASSPIVLPISDEMDCRACHASGTIALPQGGWVNDPNPERDYRLNILRLHDEREFAQHGASYVAALATNGFDPAGLYTNVVVDGKPLLCAVCHASNALGARGFPNVPPLTTSMHGFHAHVADPLLATTLDNINNRAACYRCHPGSTTKCLRGAMGAAVASDGSMAMQCQSCHGTMSQVGSSARVGWFMEPACQSCHTGTAANNNGQLRYTSVFEPGGAVRAAVDQTFATTPNTPAPGLSLYRFSVGHGGLQCEACHGSTHAEFPSTHTNDNLRNIQLQGHIGVMAECTACHTAMPNTVTGGPHGMHPIGQTWVNQHGSLFENGAVRSQCQLCHGLDYRGTVLSQAQADRSLVAGSDNGTASLQLFRGAIVGCYTCHNGPSGDNFTGTAAPTVGNVSANTAVGQSVAITVPVTGANASLRIISQPAHGTAGLNGHMATYFPDAGFTGTDTFTFAAYDGAKNSTLGTATIAVGVIRDTTPPKVDITSPTSSPTYTAGTTNITLSGSASDNVGVVSVTWTNNRGAGGLAVGTTSWTAPDVALQPGVNVITVTGYDAAGNAGKDTLTVTYSATASLTVLTSGNGIVLPDLKGRKLSPGRRYTLTARPGAGYVFGGWSGSLLADTPTLSFVLYSNMVLQAAFVPNPFLPVKGTYYGLFSDATGMSAQNSGSFTLTVAANGAVSGNLLLGAARYPFTSQLGLPGSAHAGILRRSTSALSVDFQLDLTNVTGQVAGTVSSGSWVAELSGNRAGFDGKTSLALQQGKYTIAIPGVYDVPAMPAGHGYGTLVVSKAGRVAVSVVLADGTRFARATALSTNGQCPLYASVYGYQGLVSGWLACPADPANAITGAVTWVRPSLQTSFYPAGFTMDAVVLGSQYHQPPRGTAVLNFTNATLALSGGDLAQDITSHLAFGPGSSLTGTNGLHLTFSLATGLFHGTVLDPATSKPVSFGGAVLQNQQFGAGCFLGDTQWGEALLTSP